MSATAIRDIERIETVEQAGHRALIARIDRTLATDWLCRQCHEWISIDETSEVTGHEHRLHIHCGGIAIHYF